MRPLAVAATLSFFMISAAAEAQLPEFPPAPSGNFPWQNLPLPSQVTPPTVSSGAVTSGEVLPANPRAVNPMTVVPHPASTQPPSAVLPATPRQVAAPPVAPPHNHNYNYDAYGMSATMMNPTGGQPAYGAGLHPRYPFFSYRAPWYTPGPASWNVTIVW